MKKFKSFLVAATLLCAISSSIYAGDIGTPGCPIAPTPTPPPPGDIGTPGVPATVTPDGSSMLLTEALLTIISAFR
jgi:hypothetical protein